MAGEDFGFEALADLRNYLATVRANHVPTMNHYASPDGKGFWHHPQSRTRPSLSSTATCVASLVHSGLWKHQKGRWGSAVAISKNLLRRPWKSAKLDPDNPFSLSFIGQGVLDLIEAGPYPGDAAQRRVVIKNIVPMLISQLERAAKPFGSPGSVGISPYPPSAYLTQLAFRLLDRCKSEIDGFAKIARKVRIWSRGEIYRQVSLITTESRLADPLQLAYAVVLLVSSSVDETTSPEEKALIREGLKTFFDTQQDDGTWVLSQSLFHYPAVGNAHCFDYELLTELLRCAPLQDDLLLYMTKLKRAADHLVHVSFDLGDGAVGWASGHHPQIEGPESWSTASVYDFVFSLDRLVAEAIRRVLFSELRTVYVPPGRMGAPDASRRFAPDLLDAPIQVGDEARSLRTTIKDYFVAQIDGEKHQIVSGGRLSRTVPMSAILFGPPGTSKTQLAKHIGRYLDWPVLLVDPSYVVQDGLDHIYARANRLFAILATTEQVVVLLDEFDELGRDRTHEPEVLSRFITTAMLPKLVAINEERKIVVLLATNHVARFDAAFRRDGRFDMVVQVMPPTAEAKLGKAEWAQVLGASLGRLSAKRRTEARGRLEDLTYLETEALVFRLSEPVDDVQGEVEAAYRVSTLNRKIDDKTWKEIALEEQTYIRLPPVRVPADEPVLQLGDPAD